MKTKIWLTDAQRREICELYARGDTSYQRLAVAYNVDQNTVSRVIHHPPEKKGRAPKISAEEKSRRRAAYRRANRERISAAFKAWYDQHGTRFESRRSSGLRQNVARVQPQRVPRVQAKTQGVGPADRRGRAPDSRPRGRIVRDRTPLEWVFDLRLRASVDAACP